MGHLTIDCPHCHTNSVSLTSFADVQKEGTYIWLTAFYCNSCFGGYFAEILAETSIRAHGLQGDISNNQNLEIKSEYPVIEAIAAPQFLPGNIEKFYLQAAGSLESENYDASSMMSRKVLEVAVKTLEPDGKGNLYNRIESLANGGKITEELKDWAHIIRDDGNDATHEEDPVSPGFAKELLSFSEMFLMYTFTMPGMVDLRRPKENDHESEKSEVGQAKESA